MYLFTQLVLEQHFNLDVEAQTLLLEAHDPHPPTDSHHQFCPQGAPVPGCSFTKVTPMIKRI